MLSQFHKENKTTLELTYLFIAKKFCFYLNNKKLKLDVFLVLNDNICLRTLILSNSF